MTRHEDKQPSKNNEFPERIELPGSMELLESLKLLESGEPPESSAGFADREWPESGFARAQSDGSLPGTSGEEHPPVTLPERAGAAGQQGFPPRRLKHQQPSRDGRTRTGPFPYMTLLKAGLALFGTLFFVLIGFELYKAAQSAPAKVTVEEKGYAPAGTASTQPIQQTEQAGNAKAPLPAEKVGAEANGQGGATGGTDAVSLASPGAGQTTGESSLAGDTDNTNANPSSPASASSATGVAARPQAGDKNGATAKSDVATKNNGAAKSEASAKNGGAPKPQTAAEQSVSPAEPGVRQHKVKKGETLFQLSRLYYGHNSGVKKIASYNGISADAQLVEGQIVKIPPQS
ncbi:LysM peptidoglycan-binding domain-containing protein [Brevibacillus composti]|nr:LysM peptidoglycan-binding domain-containing protein [Brevibacillus composti]